MLLQIKLQNLNKVSYLINFFNSCLFKIVYLNPEDRRVGWMRHIFRTKHLEAVP